MDYPGEIEKLSWHERFILFLVKPASVLTVTKKKLFNKRHLMSDLFILTSDFAEKDPQIIDYTHTN